MSEIRHDMGGNYEVDDEKALKLGYRRQHLAALYAHLRTLIDRTMSNNDPVLGMHAFYFAESGQAYTVSAGSTPSIDRLLSGVASLQGLVIASYVERSVGNLKAAQVGDAYDPALGKTRCVSCEDGDPTGEHAQKELQENGRAMLGAVIAIAEQFYGEHLSAEARAALAKLREEALPAGAHVS